MHLRLKTDLAQADISPSLGASVLNYRLTNGTDIFRPAQSGEHNPFRTACFPMIPWSNRLSGQIRDLSGKIHKIGQTHQDHPLPIHGSAATQQWKVKGGRSDEITLALSSETPAPFRYDATITYKLSGAALSAAIAVTNTAEEPLPYGIGLHPSFPRVGKVRLRARATHYQTTGADLLPTGEAEIESHPDWNFTESALLPETLIDTCFSGWDGTAVLGRYDGWGVEITTEPTLECYQVYSPDADAKFFCFEPVSHPVNAHNMDGHPGLWPLKPGANARVTVTFSPII